MKNIDFTDFFNVFLSGATIPCPFTYAFSACLRNSSSSVLPLLSFHSVQPFALAPKTKQAAALGEENDMDLLR